MSERIPVLIVSGTVGAGKTVTSEAVSALLTRQGVAHFLTDLDYLALTYPRPADDPWGKRIMLANLASIWANSLAAGATRAVLARALVEPSDVERVGATIPGSHVTVVRITAPQPLIQARLAGRDAGRALRWSAARSPELDAELDRYDVADFSVSNDGRSVDDVAADVLAMWDARIASPTPAPGR